MPDLASISSNPVICMPAFTRDGRDNVHAVQTREKAWGEQGTNSKKWYTQPPPGQPRDKDDSKFEKDPPNSVHPEFVLVSSTLVLLLTLQSILQTEVCKVCRCHLPGQLRA